MDTQLQKLFESAQLAGRNLQQLNEDEINKIIEEVANEAEAQAQYIITENAKDVALMDKSDPKLDRLILNEQRIADIVKDLRNVAKLPSPVGRVLMSKTLPNGLDLTKITTPFGVIGIIYEARPNVSFDVFSLCLKSGNACILKGGSDAKFSNTAIVNIIREVLVDNGVDANICMLLPNDREATTALLHAREYVDLIIPRGSQGLISFVRENAKVPVIETGAGVCHTYFHTDGDKAKGKDIITNAKVRKVSVCNSLDCLIIDKTRIGDLPYLCQDLAKHNVIIYADKDAFAVLNGHYPASRLERTDANSFGTEFLDYKMSIKTVADFNDALGHIAMYSSKHSEAIVSEDDTAIKNFYRYIDAACVYSNASTAFTDGAQFGLGAEIGISTQKMHARGPMALEELCSYKWIVKGDGQVR